MDISRVLPGKPGAYGATVAPNGINFALFSRNAERVILNLFDAPNAKQPCDVI